MKYHYSKNDGFKNNHEMSKKQLLDEEQLEANRTEDNLNEIELLRAAEKHYESRLWAGRIGMEFIFS